MGEPDATELSTLLLVLLDEMRETSSLLRVADLTRTARRPWWRNLFFATVKTKSEVNAGFALQYLGENIDRARDHWVGALQTHHQLLRVHGANDLVVLLSRELEGAGFHQVRPALAHDTIPRQIAQAATHLAAVLTKIRDCDALVVRARSQLLLQKMREPE